MNSPPLLSEPADRMGLLAACLLHAALAALVLIVSVTRPLHGIPQPMNLRVWFPLGFAISTLIAYAMAWHVGTRDRGTVLALDLVAWLALPACIIEVRSRNS